MQGPTYEFPTSFLVGSDTNNRRTLSSNKDDLLDSLLWAVYARCPWVWVHEEDPR